jgi:uncharacterized protein (DUF433 family)
MNPGLIISDPKIMMGKPVVKGTRITVELILEKLGAGESMEEILVSHPRLTKEGILAAWKFGKFGARIRNGIRNEAIQNQSITSTSTSREAEPYFRRRTSTSTI